jgi:hypothetical protein
LEAIVYQRSSFKARPCIFTGKDEHLGEAIMCTLVATQRRSEHGMYYGSLEEDLTMASDRPSSSHA